MASIVLHIAGSVIGQALGGPIGAQIGGAIGTFAGARIDAALMPRPTVKRTGPRLVRHQHPGLDRGRGHSRASTAACGWRGS